MLFIDTETTGLQWDDEIVEIAIVNENGKAVLDTLVKPINHTTWPDAQAIHGITPEMVSQAPTYDELKAKIRELTQGETVIIYNKDYDIQYIGPELSDAAKIECCMLPFAEYLAEWNSYYDGYRWQTLLTAANYVCHNWQESAHRAKSDCLATRSVWIYLTSPGEQQRVADYKQEQEAFYNARKEIEDIKEREFIEDRNHYKAMTKFFLTWWLKANTLKHWSENETRYAEWEIEEIYSKIFYGKTIDQIWLEDSAKTIYRSKKDIPDNLVSKNWFTKKYVEVGVWFINELQETDSVYAGNRTVWTLYDKSEYERIKSLYPLRLIEERIDCSKYKLVSKTEARKHNIDISGLKPHCEVQTGYGEWYYLYKVNRPQKNKGKK